MNEVFGNIWELEGYDGLCITTNGFVKNDGSCVMGKGIAKQAVESFPHIQYRLGNLITKYGNHVHKVEYDILYDQHIFSFPVKHNWWEKADLRLIQRSCVELIAKADKHELKKILLPKPGCGNGKLNWPDVKKNIENLLDDRVFIVDFAPK